MKYEIIKEITPLVEGIGGYGALLDLGDKYLVSTTDGVGTKLRLAIELDRLDTIGIDLVAMGVNDLICTGAKPLQFLDYFAFDSLSLDQARRIIKGIHQGCELAGCKLVGGETAVMQGFYKPGDFDLAGFTIGTVDKDKLLPQNIKEGDLLIGIPSSGPHANGFTQLRPLVGHLPEWHDWLMTPTRLYNLVLKIANIENKIKGLAHITGEGIFKAMRVTDRLIFDNLPKLDGRWKEIQDRGSFDNHTMRVTFNCGVGMIIFTDKNDAEQVETSVNGSIIGCVY